MKILEAYTNHRIAKVTNFYTGFMIAVPAAVVLVTEILTAIL